MEKYAIQKIILRKLTEKKAHNKSQFVKKVALIITEADPHRKTKPEYLVQRKIRKMEEDGLVKIFDTAFSPFITITKAGRQKLAQMKLLSPESILPREWDGLWRIVVVNAKREEKELQDSLRYILRKAKFVQLKASVWISPLPLEELVAEVRRNLDLKRKLFVFVAQTVDSFTQEELEEIYLERILNEKK